MDLNGTNKILSPDDFDAIIRGIDEKKEDKSFNPPKLPEQLVSEQEVTKKPTIPNFNIPKKEEVKEEPQLETIEIPDNIIHLDFARISSNTVGEEIEEEHSYKIALTEEQKKVIKKVKPYIKGGIAAVLVALGIFAASREIHEYSYEKNFSAPPYAASESDKDYRPHKLNDVRTNDETDLGNTNLALFGDSIADRIISESNYYKEMKRPYDVKQHFALYLGVAYNRITKETSYGKFSAFDYDYSVSFDTYYRGFMADIYHYAIPDLNKNFEDLNLPITIQEYLEETLGMDCKDERSTEKALQVLGKQAAGYVHSTMNPANKVEKDYFKQLKEEKEGLGR